MFYRAGRVSNCGSKIRKGWVAPQTAAVLERLDAAGAADIGTLNMAEFAYGPTGHNDHWGDCCNPWKPACITGGSSSGSGAAVAARLVFGALGSDTGGSVRLPAAACGITGLKTDLGPRVAPRRDAALAFARHHRAARAQRGGLRALFAGDRRPRCARPDQPRTSRCRSISSSRRAADRALHRVDRAQRASGGRRARCSRRRGRFGAKLGSRAAAFRYCSRRIASR